MCAKDVRLGRRAIVDDFVIIEKGSRFGDDLIVGGETAIGQNVDVGHGVEFGIMACVPDGIWIENDRYIRNLAKVTQTKPNGKEIRVIRPRPGYRYVMQNGQCVHKRRPVPKKTKYVPCATLAHIGKFIDKLARCAKSVTFDREIEIGPNTIIEDGSDFGNDNRIGDETRIGRFVYTGNRVFIGRFACIEDESEIPDNTDIESFGAWLRNGKNVEGEYGEIWEMRKGRCIKVKR